jgi:hypothetical protein
MNEHRALLPRYQQLRQAGIALGNRLARTLPRDVLDEGGRKLGILKNNVLVLDTEDEIVVLMDYCIYDVRRQGKNAVERYLAESPPPVGSDERLLLEAMLQARYSLFVVESMEPGVGVHVRDLLRDESLFLMDVSFSTTAVPGAVLATRVFAPDGILRTTGAALPVGMIPARERDRFVQGLRAAFHNEDFRHMTPERASQVSATVIHACLEKGAAEHIRYDESGGTRPPTRGPAAPRTVTRRVGRNDPCPCGSGRKFKHCCGARR